MGRTVNSPHVVTWPTGVLRLVNMSVIKGNLEAQGQLLIAGAGYRRQFYEMLATCCEHQKDLAIVMLVMSRD